MTLSFIDPIWDLFKSRGGDGEMVRWGDEGWEDGVYRSIFNRLFQ
ncbi:hypothetical protein [Okeania sp. KiyG1]|nr:hypothetical protein [Okeania sp. KiyG1]